MDSSKIRAALTLVGIALAGNYAMADELIVVASAKTASENVAEAQPASSQSALAREATLAAAKQAVAAVLSETKKDLDIHFVGTTSVKRGGAD